MIKYAELVDYIKRNHVNWNTDLFDVLRGFFDEYSSRDYLPPPPSSTSSVNQKIIMPRQFKEPKDREYTTQDLIDLFNT